MVDIRLITDPAGHRRAEREWVESLGAEFGDDTIIIVVGDVNDDWFCDYCDRPIDLTFGSILSVNQSALCHSCAVEVLNDAPAVRIGTEFLIPVCVCVACCACATRLDSLRTNG